MNPFVDFTTYTTEDLLKENQKYTKQLYKMDGSSPLYQYILDLRASCQQEYNERMYIQANKEKIKEPEQVLDIGEIESVNYTPNYMDDKELFIKAVADSYKKKDGKES
tara:strand:- start:318 stop:641 length:324 start_codon:yes stop_codon:yes gene_type:complete